MKRVIVYCEGPSEETFVKQLLAPEFYEKDIYLQPTSCNGVSKYSIIKKQLTEWCRHDKRAWITTMLDYYAIPSDTPGLKQAAGDVFSKVEYVEECIKKDVGERNFLPNLVLHEFEALLFSKPECFSYCIHSKKSVAELCAIREAYRSPEHINNNKNTAPSKRILQIYPQYNKILDGYNIAKDIGIAKMRSECKHFCKWLENIEKVM